MTVYPIVVFGATAFTAKTVVHHLDSSGTHFAIAGRNRQKLEALSQNLSRPAPIILADVKDVKSLEKMVDQAQVICTLAGPYHYYGEDLVRLCAEKGKGYVDLTGETPWYCRMIKKYDAVAKKTGARLVSSVGYDSVPSDLTTLYAVELLKKLGAKGVGEVKCFHWGEGGVSGGTLTSGLAALNETPPEEFKEASKPYSCSPVTGKEESKLTFTNYDPLIKKCGGPFIMSIHNEKVVRRSWGLYQKAAEKDSSLAWGPDFTYTEYMTMPNRFVATLFALVYYSIVGCLAYLKPMRKLAAWLGPKAGEGPKDLHQGHLEVNTVARSADRKKAVEVTFKGLGDPGYFLTAIMMAESARLLAEDPKNLTKFAREGGFLTPATAFGLKMKDRLVQHKAFEITDRVLLNEK